MWGKTLGQKKKLRQVVKRAGIIQNFTRIC